MQLAVVAAPEHAEAWALLAAALEQLGCAAEWATWRNAYPLTEQELCERKWASPPRPSLSPAPVSALTTELPDYLAVQLNPERQWCWFGGDG